MIWFTEEMLLDCITRYSESKRFFWNQLFFTTPNHCREKCIQHIEIKCCNEWRERGVYACIARYSLLCSLKQTTQAMKQSIRALTATIEYWNRSQTKQADCVYSKENNMFWQKQYGFLCRSSNGKGLSTCAYLIWSDSVIRYTRMGGTSCCRYERT